MLVDIILDFSKPTLIACGDHHNDRFLIVNAETQQVCHDVKFPGNFTDTPSLAAIEGGFLACGNSDGSVMVWDCNTGYCRFIFKAHTEKVCCLASLCNKRLASGSNDKLILVWDLGKGCLFRQLRGHTLSVKCLAALPNNLLASGSLDRTIRIWETESGRVLRTLSLSGDRSDYTCCLALLPDSLLAAGHDSGAISIWDTSQGVCTAKLNNTSSWNRCNSLAVVKDGSLLACACVGRRPMLWDWRTRTREKVLSYDHVICLAALPNGYLQASGRLIDVDTGECVAANPRLACAKSFSVLLT